MTEENLEIVRQLQPGPEVDLTELFTRDADEAEVKAAIEAAEPAFTDDFACVFHALSEEPRYGVAGLREAWLDWLSPWASYRTELEEMIDAGDRILVLVRDFGRRQGMEQEVELIGSAVWTVRGGRIARAEFFSADRAGAFRAAGLDA